MVPFRSSPWSQSLRQWRHHRSEGTATTVEGGLSQWQRHSSKTDGLWALVIASKSRGKPEQSGDELTYFETWKFHNGRRRKWKGLSVQEASQRLARVMLGLPGHAGIRHTIEAVISSRIQVKFDRHSGAAQSIRIGQVFFEEEIETTARNVGWRQARHIRRARGRRVRRDASRAGLLAKQRTPAKIVVLLRPNEFADVRMKVLAHRRSVVDHRIDQMLEGEFRSLSVAGVKRGARCETAAAAFA